MMTDGMGNIWMSHGIMGFGIMGFGMMAIVLVLVAIAFGLGYATARNR